MDSWNSEHSILVLMIGAVAGLALGSYAWGWMLYCWLYNLITNHFSHRLSRIEKKLGMEDNE